jgi:hypothetical protein
MGLGFIMCIYSAFYALEELMPQKEKVKRLAMEADVEPRGKIG